MLTQIAPERPVETTRLAEQTPATLSPDTTPGRLAALKRRRRFAQAHLIMARVVLGASPSRSSSRVWASSPPSASCPI